jgi:hypothetical protein
MMLTFTSHDLCSSYFEILFLSLSELLFIYFYSIHAFKPGRGPLKLSRGNVTRNLIGHVEYSVLVILYLYEISSTNMNCKCRERWKVMASVSHYNGIKQQNRSKNDAINLPFKAEAVNKEKEICHYYVASDKASFVSVKPHTHLRQSLGHCTRNNDTFNRWIKKLSR